MARGWVLYVIRRLKALFLSRSVMPVLGATGAAPRRGFLGRGGGFLTVNGHEWAGIFTNGKGRGMGGVF